MDLVATIDKKFAVDGGSMKVVLVMRASKENVDFINSVKGMTCNVYVQTLTDHPARDEREEEPNDDSQADMFEGNADPTPDADVSEPLDMPDQLCVHNLPISDCALCSRDNNAIEPTPASAEVTS